MIELKKSLLMQDRAKEVIPGITQLLSKRPDQFSLGVWPGYFYKAKGVEVWDLDNNHYIDMSLGGIGATVLGYADDDVDEAVCQVIKSGVSSSLNCPEEVELAELLCAIHPWASKVRFARTGGEANTIAIRIARGFTGKEKIAFCGYHGWHDWYLAANLKQDALGGHLLPGLNPIGVPQSLKDTAIPFHYHVSDELKDIVSKNKGELAAIIMEPIRNEEPVAGFFEEVQAIAKAEGIVLIIDEISAGFRLNSGGAHLKLGFEPDIAVFAKAIGNGYPISAVIGKSDVMQAAENTFISSTSWTERTGPAAAIATIKKFQKNNVANHLVDIGTQVQKGWNDLAKKNGLKIQVGGIPPLSHFTFCYLEAQEMKAYFVQEMLERGFLASTTFYAMYAHTSEHVKSYLSSVDQVFAEIMELLKAGSLAKKLRGLPSQVGFKRLT